ncbi:hypothetical protein [Stenotrophomonas sp.]|uniref:hypothetical protein n=1 Tax=Stenotrophomonas sp. TaxID=69392 RepID=UPI0028A0A1DD|nr:hypothetical protein [Stenotrophomonas sp.]
MTPRQAITMAMVVVLLSIGGCYYLKGRTDAATSAENKALQAQVRATSDSVQISRGTSTAVDLEAHETRERTAKAVEAIHATAAHPDPASSNDVLRIAREAHERAIRAACRVQRTSDCPASAGAAQSP